MYVRLAFAVAAHLEPEILIVDEVLAVGDAQFQKKCLGKMQDVSTREGRTVLFVSHQMGVIASLCKKCVVLEKGHTSFIGDVQSAISKYSQSSNVSPGRYEIDPSTVNGKKNSILSVQLEDVAGEPRSEFAFSENIHLSIHLSIPHPEPNLYLGVGLDDFRQSRVFTILRDVSELRPPGGETVLKLRLPSALIASNRYSLTLAIFHLKGAIQDHVQNVCPFSIFDDGSPMARFEGLDVGSVIVDAKWIDDL